MSQVPMQQNQPAYMDVTEMLRRMAEMQQAQQQMGGVLAPTQQQAQVPQLQQQRQPIPPTRGTEANPALMDSWFGAGTSDKTLGYAGLMGAVAQALSPNSWGGRLGGTMSGVSKGEMASRNASDQRAQQYRQQQQMMELFKALMQSRQGG